ncbi:autotransporter secretion outer membrane protein TamA [Roseiarcus fermentans]|uniref:Autotransporter secretion outer membrane protein TamA n=1 Tax=Roseiarcus fermentans TaxID=1473586 RepID=A0A366EYB0_9HYPH|nr:BamA/TamA family outer membrane protein [Roseiarcus fermentans]RBP07371.1 autotransporter secretion outer membrane protein TamA [Roseiarcus fermentans]
MATLAAFGALCVAPEGANAFDFFGLFGSESPPPVSNTAVSYTVTIDVAGGDGAIKSAASAASSLVTLRKDPPPDGDALARRATNDFGPIIDALWGLGYYNAAVTIAIGDAAMTVVSPNLAGFARAADSFRGRAVAPVTIRIDPGPMFRLASIRIVNGAGEDLAASGALPDRVVGLKPGDPAAADGLRAAEARIVDYFRNQGRPLAKVLGIAPVVNHATDTMDVTFLTAPGPVAPFGDATLVGPKDFPQSVARSYLYIEPGDPYSPKAIADARNGLREIPAVGGVRIIESKTLDAAGRLPYQVDIDDRLPYAAGASAKYSSLNGPAGQVYWEDRNVFGGGERLRLQAEMFYAPPWYMTSTSVKSLSINDLGGRISASFLKPALWGSRNDFLLDALGEKVSTSGVGFVGYQAEDADVTAALRHRFSQSTWIQAGVEGQTGVATDSLGRVNYTLVGVPLSANYDTTDSKLDPTTGVRLNATIAGYPEFLGSTLNLGQFKARASAYYSVDPDQRFVLAGRIGLGAEVGPALGDIPANWRFYAGGGGSVRGYAYDSLGPRNIWGVTGGRSLFEASAEVRIKITDTIGIVPFFDAGNAFTTPFPNFSMPLYTAAGLGLRYYTAIGPIRLDVAHPFLPAPGSGPVAVYVSIGQAF